MNQVKTFVLATALLLLPMGVQAREIHLSCTWRNDTAQGGSGKVETERLVLNPVTSRASDGHGSAPLTVTPTSYSFFDAPGAVLKKRHSVNRSTLTYTLEVFMDGVQEAVFRFKGACKVVETANKI